MNCRLKKFSFISLFVLCLCILSCGVSGGEVVKAESLPVLQVCPGQDEVENKKVFDSFVEPDFIEEWDGNVIVIKSDVPQVDVTLNSTYMGKTELAIKDLLPGQYILELSKEGYENQRCFINVNKNRKSYFNFNMKKTKEI